MGPWGAVKAALSSRAAMDGLAVSGLLVLLVCAERFDQARSTVQVLLSNPSLTPTAAERDAASPDLLRFAFVVLALVGGALARHVARRFIDTATQNPRLGWLPHDPLLLPLGAFGAVLCWVLWQLTGALAVADLGVDVPTLLPSVLHWSSFVLAVVTVAAGGVVRDASEGWDRASVVRVQLLFLGVLSYAVFAAPFTSDQMVDVLRAWGDGGVSRPLAGVAAALLLGAVGRASASRLLLPAPVIATKAEGKTDHESDGQGAGASSKTQRARGLVRAIDDHPGKRIGLAVALAAAAGLLLAKGLEAAAFLMFAVGALTAVTRPASALKSNGEAVLDFDAGDSARLERFAGTLGIIAPAILLVGLVSALVDSLLLVRTWPTLDDLVLAMWAATVVAVVACVIARAHGGRRRPATPDGADLPGPVTGVVVMLLCASVALPPAVETFGLAVLAVLTFLLAVRVFASHGKHELWAAWGAAAGVAFAVYVDPVGASRTFGALALTLFGASAVLAGLHIAGSVGVRRETIFPLGAAARPAPVLTLLVAWVLVAYLTAPSGVHQARTLDEGNRPAIGVERAVADWLDRQPDPAEGGYVPMLIVAASGGGSKAAYWTDLVLDCIFGAGVPTERMADECPEAPEAAQRFERLFLTSSVSGGSIGIHHLVNHRRVVGRREAWLDATAAREVLSPAIGWGFFHDLPVYLLGLPTDPTRCERRLNCPLNADRALVQEEAIGTLGDGTSGSADTGLLEFELPITVFAGTADWGPGRVLASRLTLASPLDVGCPTDGAQPITGAVDAHDVLDDQDVPLVTAAMLSARFPALEPPGRLGTRDDPDRPVGCRPPPPQRSANVRDGGIVENSGLLTVTELLPSIQRGIDEWHAARPKRSRLEVRPIVVSIDDDVPGVRKDNDYSRETLGLGTSGNRTIRARKRLRDCRQFDGVTFRLISPSPHVGAQAATGWEISKTSRRHDLGATLRDRQGTVNDAVAEIRNMLDGSQRPGCR